MLEELKEAVEGARYAIRIGIGNAQERYLAKYGDVLIAAANLSEAAVARFGMEFDEKTGAYLGEPVDGLLTAARMDAALAAYRKAKENPNEPE